MREVGLVELAVDGGSDAACGGASDKVARGEIAVTDEHLEDTFGEHLAFCTIWDTNIGRAAEGFEVVKRKDRCGEQREKGNAAGALTGAGVPAQDGVGAVSEGKMVEATREGSRDHGGEGGVDQCAPETFDGASLPMSVGVAELAVDAEVGEGRSEFFPKEDCVAISTEGDNEGLIGVEASKEEAKIFDDVNEGKDDVVLLVHEAEPVVVGEGVDDGQNILVLRVGDGAEDVDKEEVEGTRGELGGCRTFGMMGHFAEGAAGAER